MGDKTASNKIKEWTQTNNKINKLTNLFLLLEMIKQMSKNQLKISLKMLIKTNNKTTQKMKMMKRENHNQNKEKAIRTRKTEKHSIQTNERKHLKISQSRQNR